MKCFLYSFLLLLLLLVSCTTESNTNMEAYNPEVFAFNLGDEYEVNATVRLKGLEFQKEGEEYKASVGYELDLIKPDGGIEKSILSKIEDLTFDEKVKDTGIDIQFNLDSTYTEGKYTLVFNLNDAVSGRTASAQVEFTLD